MDIPKHLQRMQMQIPTFLLPRVFVHDRFPQKIPLSKQPGELLRRVLREATELRIFDSDPEIEPNLRPGDVWRPEYYLGGGASGQVAFFTKRNSRGEVVDEIAMKEIRHTHEGEGWDPPRVAGSAGRILNEAVFQRQLNSKNSESACVFKRNGIN